MGLNECEHEWILSSAVNLGSCEVEIFAECDTTKCNIKLNESEIEYRLNLYDNLRKALIEQLNKRGYAFRGICDGVPDDVRRAFIATGTPCDEIDKKILAEKKDE